MRGGKDVAARRLRWHTVSFQLHQDQHEIHEPTGRRGLMIVTKRQGQDACRSSSSTASYTLCK